MHLERHLSVRLLNRTSRHVSLTEVGAAYFEQAGALMEDLEGVEALVSRTSAVPKGTIRMTAPVWMANPRFARVLAEFCDRYPEVSFDIDLSDRQVSLVNEGFDLALRVSRDLGSGLVARRLAEFEFRLVGAPAYLDRRGRPGTLSELEGHDQLQYSLMPRAIALGESGERVPARSKMRAVLRSGNETLLHCAALAGQGLANLPLCLVGPDVAAERLEIVLPDQASFAVPLYAVYPSRRHLSGKIRTFIDFLTSSQI